MPDHVTPLRPDVVLGFDAAWGFAPADQTSPALAAGASALIDVTMTDQPVTELRIHGVSGSNGQTMLEHPGALQVAGDSVTGFYRRWSADGPGRPSVPWKLEAYSWGGLTEAPLASASWLLLAPFMMYNVAHFMLPPPAEPAPAEPPAAEQAAAEQAVAASQSAPPPRGSLGHRVAGGLLRLLALTATVQFVSAAVAVTVSTVAWQAAGRAGMLPAWMGWYGAWTAGWRIALAMAAVAAVVAALWWVSVKTASKYEARTSNAQSATGILLAEPGFWKGDALVRRQRALHSAAALATAALIAALPAVGSAAARWAAVSFAAVVLAAAAALVVSPLAARHRVSLAEEGEPPDRRTDSWCRAVLAAGVVALLLTAAVSGWTDHRQGPQSGALPGISTFLAVLLAVQVALLIALTIVVAVLARRAFAGAIRSFAANNDKKEVLPYLHGWLAALVAALGFALGGLLAAVVNFGVTRLIGTPEPSGFVFDTTPANALAVPWPIFAFGAAPIGLLVGAVPAAVLLIRSYRGHCRTFLARVGNESSQVAADYGDFTAKTDHATDGDGPAYAENRTAISKAWAIGRLADDAAFATALMVGGVIIVVLGAELAVALTAGPASHPGHLSNWWHGLASMVALLGVLVAGLLVTLLRQAYSAAPKRKTIGALWDVATFWPRAVHPLAPPCYAERAVPEIVDRILLLTGHEADDGPGYHAEAGRVGLSRTHGLTVPPGPVLLTGYSQGSVIAPAVIAQLPSSVRSRVALLTLACPVRRLYGRAFPAYFGDLQLAVLARLLGVGTATGQPGGRWKNLYRRSDYIGSWIFATPEFRLNQDDLRNHVDQPCWDPVILVPAADQTPPPTHRHSGWWPDPRTHELGKYLVDLLASLGP